MVDRQAPERDEETGCGRRMGAAKDCRTLGGRTKRIGLKKAQENAGCTIVRYGGKQVTRSRKGLGNWGESQDIERRLEVANRSHIGNSWRKSNLTVRKWKSEKHRSWSMPVEAFRNLFITGGSLLGVSGRWSASGWSVVQLDHHEEMEPMHGMTGILDAELEVQRTIKRDELEVERVKAHRSKKEKQQMSRWQKMEHCWMVERWRNSEQAQSNDTESSVSGGRMA